jgi:ATP-binding cassette, subfamily B, bacterial
VTDSGDPYEQALRRAEANWRAIPKITLTAIRFVRTSSPGHLERVWALQLLSGVGAAINVGVFALLTKRVIQLDNRSVGLSALWPLVLLLIVAGLFGQLASAYHTANQDIVSEQVAASSLDRILDVVSGVELEAFDDPEFRNRLGVAQAQAQIRPWQVVDSVANLSRSLFTAVGVLVAMFVLPPVTVFLLLAIVAPVAAVVTRRTRMERNFVWNRSISERMRQIFISRLNSKDGATEVRALALSAEIRRRAQELQDEILQMKRKARRGQARLMVLSNARALVIAALAITVIGVLYERGQVSVPVGTALILGISRMQNTIAFAGYSVALLHEGSLFLHDIEKFVEDAKMRSTGIERPVTTSERLPVESIRASGVSFRYPTAEADALVGVDLELRSGKITALVGENGSGKTTLAKIMAGLFRPTGGVLIWDKRDGRGPKPVLFSDLTDLRGSTAFVTQNAHDVAWPVSAHEHVAFGDITRLDDRSAVEKAASLAGASNAVSFLSLGWDTLLNPSFPGGTDLSGGEWQRISIARAFFRDAPLLLFDEPTAALDAQAEHDLFQRVKELSRARAVLIISHRLSTVRLADEIVVLEKGRVCERGSHSDLSNIPGGRYAEMYRLQAASFAQDGV